MNLAPFLVAGILNVTPDSFYDGGRHFVFESAIEHGRALAATGAGMLDIGGESTRPGAAYVPAEEEVARVTPVVRMLAEEFAAAGSGPVLAVDTYKAETAAASLEAGAGVINDISACEFEPALVDVLAEYKPGYVLMHSQGRPATMQDNPHYENVFDEVMAFFEAKMAALVKAGLPEDRIVLDPGIGFGKLLEHNLELLKRIREFERLGRPLYIGISNKSLWRGLLGPDIPDREAATQIATALLFARGVLIHRVHDAAATIRTLKLAQALER